MSVLALHEMIGPDSVRVFDQFFDHPDDLRVLREAILALRARSRQSVASLNIGGWKSEIRVLGELAQITPSAWLLGEMLQEVFERPIVSSWAMVNERGARHPWHTHKSSRMTGVLFVCADSDASPIELGDPGPERRGGKPVPVNDPKFLGTPGQRIVVPAIAGRLVLFPGRVWHQVPTVTGDGVRISLAFDAH